MRIRVVKGRVETICIEGRDYILIPEINLYTPEVLPRQIRKGHKVTNDYFKIVVTLNKWLRIKYISVSVP